MEDAFIAGVKQAFYTANVCHDCNFAFEPSTQVIAGLSVTQCKVTYVSGNEYLNLKALFDILRNFGEITIIELRGRGESEANQLLIEFRFDGVAHQVIYVLPSSQSDSV